MCAIFGSIGRRDHQGLREAALTLRHRGPDGFGEWASPDRSTYLAHCRLAIIDLSEAARQPMTNEDGSVQLTFNGEIYNFRELRAQLVAAGHRFASQADSEVIVHGYEEWGDGVVSRLRGMFAFAIWDEVKQRLLLARDHLGVKPLYYCLRGGELLFASEPRALLAARPELRSPSVDAVIQFLRFGYTMGAQSIWHGVSRLPPATTLAFEAPVGTATIGRYWQLEPVDPSWTEKSAGDRLAQLLDGAVREQLVSDVPVGVFLSGGIDSSLVASFATDALPSIDSFFVDFPGWDGSERDDALAVATHLGTHHHVSEMGRQSVELSNPDRAREFFSCFDEPFGDRALLPSWLLAGYVRRNVGVALSGDGGDELFGGYTRFEQVRATPRRRLAWQLEQTRRRAGMGREWPEGCANQAEYYHFLCAQSFTRSELATLFPCWRAEVAGLEAGFPLEAPVGGTRSAQRDWQLLDVQTYLVDNNLARMDRASMAHGLEVRVPLLDHRIASFALSLPLALSSAAEGGKPLLRGLARSRLPASLQTKKKQGFSFPLSNIISEQELIGALREGALCRAGILDARGLSGWLEQVHKGNHEFKLWLLYTLENWARCWLLGEEEAA